MLLPHFAAEAAYVLTDGPMKAVLRVAAEGLALVFVAPAALLTACAPVVYSLCGDTRTAVQDAPAPPGRRPKQTVLLAVVLVAIVALPLFGARFYARELAHVPRLAIDPAAATDDLAPDDLEPVPGGTGFASLTQDRWRDGPDALLLYACEADCPDGQARERQIDTVPEDAFLHSWAIAADGDHLLIGAVLTGSDRESDAGGLAVYRCSDDDCDGPWAIDLPASAPRALPLTGLRLAPGPDGGYAALLHGPSEPTVHHSNETPAALLTCSTFDCETPSVSRLPDVVEPGLALAPDGSVAIAHLTPDSSALHLLVCRGSHCDSSETRELDGPWRPGVPRFGGDRPAPSVAVDTSGRPHVVGVGRDGDRLLYYACADAQCSSWDSTFLLHKDDAPGSPKAASLQVDQHARPSVLTSGALIHCLAPRCDLGE